MGIAVLLALLLYTAVCASLAWEAIRPKARQLVGSPAQFGARFDDVSFYSEDGTRLSGWLVPAPRHSRGVVILCHGISSNRTAMLYAAEILYHAGYTTLLFDFRACGRSGGRYFTIGYHETDDLAAAVQFVSSHSEARGLPIGVLGQSAGAAVALLGTARCKAVRGVVAESPFSELNHAADNRFRLILGECGPYLLAPARNIGCWLTGCCPDQVSPAAAMPEIAPRPVLLIQDGADSIAPPRETARLLQCAGPNTNLWTVPDSPHVGAHLTAPAEYARRIIHFFDDALSRSSRPGGEVEQQGTSV